ncbi:MAG: hypothetical protein PVF17_09985 [Ignavibacteria bacterium]|jgi:hypothetical protein
MKNNNSKRIFPFYGYVGVMMIVIFWYLNWNFEGLRTHILFFPLWLGYILTVDAITFYRKDTSIIKQNLKLFILLFIISAPAWWLFELINLRIQNWFYDGKQFFTDIEYALLCTLSFSTVMPAVFCTAKLVATFKWINKFQITVKTEREPKLNTIFLIGIVLLALALILPGYFYYFEWLAVYLIIEPINYRSKNNTLLKFILKGDWRPVIALSVGALICGFFWEMWNYYSYPKWVYNTPMVNFLHIFEMPLLGYVGYVPFAWELFALFSLISGSLMRFNPQTYKLEIRS